MSSRHEMHQGRKPGPPNVPRGRPAIPVRKRWTPPRPVAPDEDAELVEDEIEDDEQ